mgnify:CR=1 FL=1
MAVPLPYLKLVIEYAMHRFELVPKQHDVFAKPEVVIPWPVLQVEMSILNQNGGAPPGLLSDNLNITSSTARSCRWHVAFSYFDRVRPTLAIVSFLHVLLFC